MSTKYYVNLKHLKQEISVELAYIIEESGVPIGTSFSNADREKNIANLLTGRFAASELDFSSFEQAMKELNSSDKLFYTKWDKKSPIEFFDTRLRFSFYVPSDILIDAEKGVVKTMLEFWDSRMNELTPIIHHGSYPIESWSDLRNAITGPDRIMEPVNYTSGNYITLPPFTERNVD